MSPGSSPSSTFCVPFFLLLMRFVKKNPNLLRTLAIWMIFVRMLDVFWYRRARLPAARLGSLLDRSRALIGLGGIWLAYFIPNLKTRPLLVPNDPRNTYVACRARTLICILSNTAPNGAGHETERGQASGSSWCRWRPAASELFWSPLLYHRNLQILQRYLSSRESAKQASSKFLPQPRIEVDPWSNSRSSARTKTTS